MFNVGLILNMEYATSERKSECYIADVLVLSPSDPSLVF